jgi:hypothetical protein
LYVEGLPVPHASTHELGPVRHHREGILLLGEKAPQLRVVPAELVKGAVPVYADPAAELPDFGHQLLMRHRVEVLVHDLSSPGRQAYEPLSAIDAPLFSCLTEYTLGEIETFLGLGEILLETEDGSFKSLEPLRHLS